MTKQIENSLTTIQFDSEQIDSILDKLITAIAEPEDHEFFRAVLRIKAEESSSTEFAIFVKKLLNA